MKFSLAYILQVLVNNVSMHEAIMTSAYSHIVIFFHMIVFS
jgi:hypothetical protein